MNRLLAPSLNAPGLSAALAAVAGAVLMLVHVVQHQAVFDPSIAVAGGSAVLFLLNRHVVTPVDDPRGKDGKPLIPVPPTATVSNVTVTPPAGKQAS